MALPDIVGSAEAAEILGIGPTNFAHLRKNRAGTEHPFPEPVVQLRCGPIFLKRDVDKFAKTFTPGRAAKADSADAPATKAPAKKVAAKKAPAPAVEETEVEEAPAKKAVSKKVAPKKTLAKKAPARLAKG